MNSHNFETFSYRSDNGASTSDSDHRSRSPSNRKKDDGKIEFITEFGATTTTKENISSSTTSSSKQPDDSRSVYISYFYLPPSPPPHSLKTFKL